jgi:hypothetical protein
MNKLAVNMHAYTATLDTTGADDTYTVTGLSVGTSYSFELDAFNDVQDVDSNTVTQSTTNTGETPTILGLWGNGPDGDIEGGVDITYSTTLSGGGAPYLIVTRDDDPDAIFYQTVAPPQYDDYTMGTGGAIPVLQGTTVNDDGGGVYDAQFYVPANDQNVTFQIDLGGDVSAPYTTYAGDNSWGGGVYPIPTAPTLTTTTDTAGDLIISYTAAVQTPTDPICDVDFFAQVGNSAVNIGEVQNTFVQDNGISGTFTVPANSPYIGDPIFASCFEYLDGYQDQNPYWSSYSNTVNVPGSSGNDVVTLPAPTDLTGLLVNGNDVLLHWKNNAPDASNVEVLVRPHTNANSAAWVAIDMLAANSYDDTITTSAVEAAIGTGLYDIGVQSTTPGVADSAIDSISRPTNLPQLQHSNGETTGSLSLIDYLDIYQSFVVGQGSGALNYINGVQNVVTSAFNDNPMMWPTELLYGPMPTWDWSASFDSEPNDLHEASVEAGGFSAQMFFGALLGLPTSSSNIDVGIEAHQRFLQALMEQTGTGADDWIMRTAPGQTGVDATYVGPTSTYPGFDYAELKPLSGNGFATFLRQFVNWDLDGVTRLWFYNSNGVIGMSGYSFIISP